MFYKATPESPKMFDSNFIDSFSRVPWFAVPAVWGPVIVGLLAYSALGAGVSPVWIPVQFFFGMFVWSFMEYWLHRTLFHWIPDTPWGERFHFVLHGVHHDWMNDKYRLVMPPAAAFFIAVPFFALFWGTQYLLSGLIEPTWLWGFFSGVLAGYVTYDLVHYYTHHGHPKAKWLRALKKHHLAHHTNPKYKDKKFGVSSPLWDHVFGTF